VIGINERPDNTLGTIYNTNLVIGPEGKILLKHRKLMPTYAEKLVWGFGDGSTLRVLNTERSSAVKMPIHWPALH
jgi:aliphatic nitrilase